MNTCRRLKVTLLTDYIDGETDAAAKREIEAHLASCRECAGLVAAAKEEMSAVADERMRRKAPAHLYGAIMDKIRASEEPHGAFSAFARKIRQGLMLPKLVPALAGLALLVLSASFFFYTQRPRAELGNEGIKYASELFGANGTSAAAGHEGLGTPIEEYFL